MLAQDLEPRAYTAAPVGLTFLVAGAGRSSGSVLLDPSLPVENAHATLGAATVGFGHVFDLLGRTALFVVALPTARAVVTGEVQDAARRVSRVGLADARVKLSVNLLGGAARRPREFAAAPRQPIVGVSLTAVVPTGQYSSTKLINLGSNRWSFKPEVGVSLPAGHWSLEAYAGVWLFGANEKYYPGTTHQDQDAVFALQSHVGYTFRPRLWTAFDATWYTGGVTTIADVRKNNEQRDTRLGATVSVPIGARQSLKASYSTGARTRFGADFDTLAVAWQTTWLHVPAPVVAHDDAHRNEIAAIVAGTREAGDESFVTLGTEYARRLTQRVGIAGDVQYLFDADRWVVAAPVVVYVGRGAKLFSGPGFETDDGQTHALLRVGAAYAFEFSERYSIGPTIALDVIHEPEHWQRAMVFGMTIGAGF